MKAREDSGGLRKSVEEKKGREGSEGQLRGGRWKCGRGRGPTVCVEHLITLGNFQITKMQ